MADRHPATEHLLSLFEMRRTDSADLDAIYAGFTQLAHDVANRLPDGPELTTGLRKLLEAKDCCVRQAIIGQKAKA
ncbi:hypothetical protein WKY82_20300 [Gordonia malaquae]|uniref:hypothetical protein n=1 Tax=Gordonia malaquae TaxID=410332 RepID=UPI0030C78708